MEISKNFIFLFFTFYLEYCKALDETGERNETLSNKLSERKSRANLVSFEPVGSQIKMGLDYLLPFMKVPIMRHADAYGKEPALVNINTAAIISTSLLAGSGAIVSYLFRRYVVLNAKEESDKRRRSDNDFEQELWSTLSNFKLVYTNSSGARVDTSLAGLFSTIDETFQSNNIDLSSCIQKAICTRIQLSARRVNEGNSSGVDKIIDGLMGLSWLRQLLRHTSLRDALDSNHQRNNFYCDTKYGQCKWSVPEENLMDLIGTYLKFT